MAAEAEVEELELVAVRVGVRWQGVDADQPDDLRLDAGLLVDLPDQPDRGLLTGFEDPGRQCPAAVVGPAYQQDALLAASTTPVIPVSQSRSCPIFSRKVRMNFGVVMRPSLASPGLPTRAAKSR